MPLAFALTPLGTPPLVAIVLMLVLHTYITSNVPMGVPLEWNVAVVYGGFALFWAHPDMSPLALAPGWVAGFVFVSALALPVLGNVKPALISFLLAMRYYAGNWACSVWLVRKDAVPKLERLTKSSGWIYDQLSRFYDRRTAVGMVGKVMAFRLMHLHGRCLPHLVPRAVERLQDYEWLDGELVAGMALGWNFGEGHLHHEQLLASLQRQVRLRGGRGAMHLHRVAAASAAGAGLAHRGREGRAARGGRAAHRGVAAAPAMERGGLGRAVRNRQGT